MRRIGRNLLLLIAACLMGLGASECLYRFASFRERLARLLGRGELLAVVHGVGIYQADRDARPDEDIEALIVAENLRHASRHEPVSNAEIAHELSILAAQFGDEKAFANALKESMLSINSLQSHLAEHLRARVWLEKQIASGLRASDDECRQLYATEREQFLQPQRFRARHLFLAAHDQTPAEDVEAKRKAIQTFAARIAKGESVAQLAAEASEDEATKTQSGDLGFFDAHRVPPEFFEQVRSLRPGQVTAPFQSYMGFHIAELTELKPSRELSFEEARAEIARTLANEKRASAALAIRQRLAMAEYLRTPL